MKPPRERALDIAWKLSGGDMSRALFAALAHDESSTGRSLRKLLDAIEAGINIDRQEIAAGCRACEALRAADAEEPKA